MLPELFSNKYKYIKIMKQSEALGSGRAQSPANKKANSSRVSANRLIDLDVKNHKGGDLFVPE